LFRYYRNPEYVTKPLDASTVGWDWFSLQFSDQTEVMLYLLREDGEGINPASSGIFVDRLGAPQYLNSEDFSVTVLERWKSSKSGGDYPVAWQLNILPSRIELSVIANLSDQEMLKVASTGVIYWEGSVSASGTVAKEPVKAEGYVELTGYAKAVRALF
jgi:predicted secreted hydrolase